jgi:hypothetical protein
MKTIFILLCLMSAGSQETLDNQITNQLVVSGELPVSELEIYPQ